MGNNEIKTYYKCERKSLTPWERRITLVQKGQVDDVKIYFPGDEVIISGFDLIPDDTSSPGKQNPIQNPSNSRKRESDTIDFFGHKIPKAEN